MVSSLPGFGILIGKRVLQLGVDTDIDPQLYDEINALIFDYEPLKYTDYAMRIKSPSTFITRMPIQSDFNLLHRIDYIMINSPSAEGAMLLYKAIQNLGCNKILIKNVEGLDKYLTLTPVTEDYHAVSG